MPFHDKNRTWKVTEVDSPQTLAKKLTGTSWTLCTGFRLPGLPYLFLNDSTSEDGMVEYAIVKEEGERESRTYSQIESITFGWCDQSEALEFISHISRGGYDHTDYKKPVVVSLQEPRDHRCDSCM